MLDYRELSSDTDFEEALSKHLNGKKNQNFYEIGKGWPYTKTMDFSEFSFEEGDIQVSRYRSRGLAEMESFFNETGKSLLKIVGEVFDEEEKLSGKRFTYSIAEKDFHNLSAKIMRRIRLNENIHIIKALIDTLVTIELSKRQF